MFKGVFFILMKGVKRKHETNNEDMRITPRWAIGRPINI